MSELRRLFSEGVERHARAIASLDGEPLRALERLTESV